MLTIKNYFKNKLTQKVSKYQNNVIASITKGRIVRNKKAASVLETTSGHEATRCPPQIKTEHG